MVVRKFNMTKDKDCVIRPYNPKIDLNPNQASRALKQVYIFVYNTNNDSHNESFRL